MTFFAFLLLAAALAAALYGAIEQGRAIEDLRERVDALAHPRAVPHDTMTTAERSLFAGLYSEREEPMVQQIGRLPAMRWVAAAAVLGLVGIAFTVTAAARGRATDRDPSKAAEVAAADSAAPAPLDSLAVTRTERDSLAILVARLRDSVRLASEGARARPVASRPSRRAAASRSSGGPGPALPPPPKLDIPATTP